MTGTLPIHPSSMSPDRELRHRKFVGDEVDLHEMEALINGQPSTKRLHGSAAGAQQQRRRRGLCSSPHLRIMLVIGSSVWIVLAFATLIYLVSSKPGKYAVVSPPLASQRNRMRASQRPIFQVHVQGEKSSSPSVPYRWGTVAREDQQRTINCHEPYRSLPLLLGSVNDPFLPWIHDYFVHDDTVRFVAQNKRRCHTGRGKQGDMAFWEPQMALLQPVSITYNSSTQTYHLAEPEHADYPETRFICRFRDTYNESTVTEFSIYPFNYEYINWRKRANSPMFVKDGPDVKIVDYSTLLFACPVPESLRRESRLYLDLIPIRTPARYDEGYLLTAEQVGQAEFAKLKRFDTKRHYGNQTELPPIDQAGRLENLPICLPDNDKDGYNARRSSEHEGGPRRRHRLVACAWVAASYERRGGKSFVSDTAQRLKEWLVFHQLAGFDQIYLYDNTHVENATTTDEQMPLKKIANLFPGFVTWIRWPAIVCNNNFIGGRWPGERSSQYAAESSCRERFGPQTEWMSFLDIDEYLVPIRNNTWGPLLDEKGAGSPVLGLRESRAHPRFDMMDETHDEQICSREGKEASKDDNSGVSCLVPRSNETFLSIFNCDSVKPPRPRGYFTNMKQIYRPDFVLSHFVHYSLITRDIAEYYLDKKNRSKFRRTPSKDEKALSFLDELQEGSMLHARSVLPYETSEWREDCAKESRHECKVGFVCSDSTRYDDKLVNKNLFVTEKGEFCNCWRNHYIDEWVPKVEAAMRRLGLSENK